MSTAELIRHLKAGEGFNIPILDGVCGSGKTQAVCKFIAGDVDGSGRGRSSQAARTIQELRETAFGGLSLRRSHLISVPIRKLADQYKNQQEFSKVRDWVIVIYSREDKPDGKSTVARLIDTLNTLGGQGAVVVACHETVLSLPREFLQRTDQWAYWIDECPGAVVFEAPQINFTRQSLNEHLTIDGDGDYPRVVAKAPARLRNMLEAPDALAAPLHTFFRRVLSENRWIYTEREAWDRIVVRGDIKYNRKQIALNELPLIGVLHPETLRHFTVIGANIRDTLLGKWLVMNGCSLVCHPLTDRLRFTDYPERDVMIFFALEKMRSSKYSMNPIMEEYERCVLRHYLKGVDRFALLANVGYQGKLATARRAVLLPPTPHGLNDPIFMDCTTFVSTAAFNFRPPHERFLCAGLGFKLEDLALEGFQKFYQAAYRTNLRRFDSFAPIKLVFPDWGTAAYIASLQPGSRVEQLKSFKKN
jgi:hypothetical protein